MNWISLGKATIDQRRIWTRAWKEPGEELQAMI